jgi:hypothetical protein
MRNKDPEEIGWLYCVGIKGATTRGRCSRFPTVLCHEHYKGNWDVIKENAKLPHSDYLPEKIEPNGRYCSICRFIVGKVPAAQ